MKKTMLLLFVCSVSMHTIAQKTESGKTPPEAPASLSMNDIPPPPPPPPPPEKPEQVKFTPPVIVNDKGYNLSVHYNNGTNMVYAKKNGVTEKILLSKWSANEAYYEKKYGALPPPPPPPPPPALPEN